MPDIRNLWESSLAVAFVIWAVVGVLLLTMPIAMALWIALGAVLFLSVYLGSDRLVRWGRGI